MPKKPITDLREPLDDDELDRLGEFLLERVDEDEVTDGQDEGVLDITELDGFLTAVVSGPANIMPSQWLPALWGDHPPQWKNEREFEAIFTLLVRHLNAIAAVLINEPESFEPIFYDRQVKGVSYTIVDEWCEGYVRGVKLAAEPWSQGGNEMELLLAPIVAFTSASDWRAHELDDESEFERLRQAIAPNVRAIHAHWFARRDPAAESGPAPVRVEKRPGRNEPCSCGSGKKYKHCCLH